LDDLKNVGESNYNPGDGTDQRVQSLVFMMMMMIYSYIYPSTEGQIMRSQHPAPHLHISQLAILNLKMASI